MHFAGRTWTRRQIAQRTGHMHQVAGARHFAFTEGRARGMRAVEVQTGAGLCFTVLPDRGMDIAQCSYRGLGLAFLAPGGLAHPAFFDPHGSEWLRSYGGGLLTTCGLTYFGPPGSDRGEDLGLHGRYAGLAAGHRGRDLEDLAPVFGLTVERL